MFQVKNAVVDQPTVVNDDLVQSVDENIWQRLHFTILKLSCEFPQISFTPFYEIITVRLGCHKFCRRCVPKMLTYAHKMQRMVLALVFLE
jgi:hypothetical protein